MFRKTKNNLLFTLDIKNYKALQKDYCGFAVGLFTYLKTFALSSVLNPNGV